MMEGVLALFIPIIAIVGTFAVAIIIVLAALRSRRIRHEMLHRERMLALEKGLPVPMDYTEQARKRRPYVTGLVWAAIGLGIVLWGIIAPEDDLNAWGLIPLFVGIALLIGDHVALKRERRNDSDSGLYPPDPTSYRGPDSPS
ncbi:hypothetical protein KKH27_01845 [bacterium]|nr:hypothetical protein [bacterium]MBU1982838.1 hypothetical protein [bacterium]